MIKLWMILLSLPYLTYGRRPLSFVVRQSKSNRPITTSSARQSHLFSDTQGRLSARIVPSALVDYKQKKPSHVDHEIASLVEQLEPLSTSITKDITKDIDTTTARSEEKDLAVLLHVTYTTSAGETVHIHSQRASNEPAEKGLKRLTINLMEKFRPKPTSTVSSKTKKKPTKHKHAPKKQQQTPSRLPTIRVGDSEINVKKRSNLELWQDLANTAEATISFPVGDEQTIDLQLDSCPPTVLSIRSFENLEQHVFCGVPLVVSTQVLHATNARISWFSNAKLVQADSNSYIPTTVGEKIQIVVTPQGSNRHEAYEFVHAVQAVPLLPVVHNLRSDWTAPRTTHHPEARLRVVTYNLLADQYAKGERPQHEYCPSELLHRSHRMPLLVYEILAYHADVICLQEVDWYIFQSLYQPVLESQGYQGFFTSKLSGQQEGCAMFWSTRKFERVDDMVGIGINEILFDKKEDGWNAHHDLFSQLPGIKCRIQELGQILQCVTLVSKEDPTQQLVVGNTHFYYHPLGDHFRVLQAYGVCRKLDELRVGDTPILLCGDLNSDPTSGAIQLLKNRHVDASHDTVWENLFLHPKQKGKAPPEEQVVTLPTLTLSPSFSHLQPSCNPKFTHCIPSFVATLDYILSSLTCSEAAAMPDEMEHMPNAGMPSDHISLVADYEW